MRGWLTAINQAALGGGVTALAACPTLPTAPNPTSSTTPDLNDLFYLELKYDGQFAGMTGDTIPKNGNINQMMWRTRGRERQAYNFNYDYLDRLRSAVYADVNDAGAVTNNSRYNESLTYADARGNIGTLKRQGGTLSAGCYGFGQIDNLSYTYSAATNKLKRIWDASNNNAGFKPNNTAPTDYAYDANGNMTSDPFKGMTVQYNHLDLPTRFTFGTNTIDILYDASGKKLRKTVAGTTNYTQDYIGGIEYRGTNREAIYTAEGRIRYISGTPRYEYTMTDHLGNSRVSFTDLNANGVVEVANNAATNEVLQEDHYYPFGMRYDGPWMNDENLDNRYQYNGKEWNNDFGLNLYPYGARYYDPTLARFIGVDPIAGSFPSVTTYNYAENEPVAHIDLWGLQKARIDPLPVNPSPIPLDKTPDFPGKVTPPWVPKPGPPENYIFRTIKSPIFKRTLGVVGFMLDAQSFGKDDAPLSGPNAITRLLDENTRATPSNQDDENRVVYRSMKRSALIIYPETGESARTLGVRPGPGQGVVDISVDEYGMVYPFTGGMSVAPDTPMNLQRFLRPSGYEGTGKNPVWGLKVSSLPPGLKYYQDKADHGLIQPAWPMPYQAYKALLESTFLLWQDHGGDEPKP